MSTSTGHEGERRQITVFFSDLSGYTALTERLDPEDVRAVMDRVFAEATSVTERYGEDDAERAIRAVIDLHRAVDEFSNEIEDRLGRRITRHSGINTGLVAIGASLDTAVGDAKWERERRRRRLLRLLRDLFDAVQPGDPTRSPGR